MHKLGKYYEKDFYEDVHQYITIQVFKISITELQFKIDSVADWINNKQRVVEVD